MKNIFILLLAFSPFILSAQHLEVGVMVGAANYEGDLSPSAITGKIKNTRAAFGGFARYNINNYVAARLNVNYGTIRADDADSKNESRQRRNLSFKSNILEFALIGELNILGYQPYNLERVFSPYLFGGIAVYKFNPQARYENEWIELQPLSTEGQGLSQYPDQEPYQLTQFAVPMGGGLKYALNDSWNIGLEMGIRMTFTDYLDDVSTIYVDNALLSEVKGPVAAALANRSDQLLDEGTNRGNPGNKDWYFFSGLTVSFNFMDNGLVGFRRKSGRNTGCPTF